ncbi:hypothetical protein L288_05475 [Sphingobium quisquiliarum P25]|uniref:Uncharacterized protein n=1 Tax=Sphingobium quisquiliarum P25 TaxID=1329909 RepID=T0ID53_9SPHN|nr:hypothetical protein [Sphingobium quisquiliarum]EQB09605.1 hypothetical protein L288_05475 [Sphingobium quisquiliarum P25]
MRGELRVLGVAHGLLLGLVLASPMIGTEALPWGVEALFIIAAFQLRLADRRWDVRAGLRGWGSHIRMAPSRLVPWAGTAVVAVIAGPGQAALAGSILTAVLLGELLIYPAAANLLGRLPRPGLAGLIILLLIACGLSEPGHASRLTAAFALGMSGCVFWMRGPDGEARATALSAASAAAAFLGAVYLPAAAPLLIPAGVLATTITLAHLSVIRRQPQHWRLNDGARPVRSLPGRS